jgi:hypothetical protein
VIILDHRSSGATSAGHMENTLEAFGWSLERGYGIETDIRMQSDGDIVISHEDLTAEEASGGGHLPTLDEFFSLLGVTKRISRDTIALHLKLGEQTPVMIKQLVTKINEHNLASIVFVFDLTRQAVDEFARHDPGRMIRLAISLGADHHSGTIYTAADLDLFADVPIIWWDEWGVVNGQRYDGQLYTANNVKALKARGKKIFAISPDVAYQSSHPLALNRKYLSVWQKMISWDIDGICTDVPKELEIELSHEKNLVR